MNERDLELDRQEMEEKVLKEKGRREKIERQRERERARERDGER